MIHQLIFAHPKPGMTEGEFQRYWLEEHAVRYASKIPQIRRYRIDTRLPLPGDGAEPLWSGIAEIWLRPEEQIESLQTPEFLEGARLDEPKWAAFWRTLVLDTDAHQVVEPPRAEGVKIVRLVKRREGLPLAAFREQSLGRHAELVAEVPGLRGYLQNHVVDGAYGIGEATLDAAYQLWFDDTDALAAALASPEFQRAEEELRSIVQERYLHEMVVREHWVIGPDAR
ncbi:ethyl tert-butyl ether degradation protein EthD [Saccharothrix sp. NRRL B-16348]|uniref:EthD domain-containing protein n=1 Tax=Saccharothrix sp. NRRL B-16348 TaxID=1415542 RepID=UPI0006AF043B|nr:EthD family reductase [Saccharothrix sp. NRRL B-16348]KOX20009.1 ethyl tert-butyl ether degradation protein EthD [Saccharothrix sp. NRRL B-16348]